MRVGRWRERCMVEGKEREREERNSGWEAATSVAKHPDCWLERKEQERHSGRAGS